MRTINTDDGYAIVVDDQAACPKCKNTPSQLLGGRFDGRQHLLRYRCTAPRCQHEFEAEHMRTERAER